MRRAHLTLRRPIAGQPVAGPQPRSPAELLGPNHPLVRSHELRGDLWRQSLVTTAAVLLGAIGAASGRGWGLPLLVAAGIVQLGLWVGLALLAQLQWERATELIISGCGGLPLPSLERKLRPLQRLRTRAGLAEALEDLVRAAERWPTLVPTARAVFEPRQVRGAAAELRAIAARLGASTAAVREVARV